MVKNQPRSQTRIRGVAVVLAMAAALSVSACGGGGAQGPAGPASSSDVDHAGSASRSVARETQRSDRSAEHRVRRGDRASAAPALAPAPRPISARRQRMSSRSDLVAATASRRCLRLRIRSGAVTGAPRGRAAIAHARRAFTLARSTQLMLRRFAKRFPSFARLSAVIDAYGDLLRAYRRVAEDGDRGTAPSTQQAEKLLQRHENRVAARAMAARIGVCAPPGSGA